MFFHISLPFELLIYSLWFCSGHFTPYFFLLHSLHFLCIFFLFRIVFSRSYFSFLDIWDRNKSHFPLISCSSFPFISLIFFFPFALPAVFYLLSSLPFCISLPLSLSNTSGIYYFLQHVHYELSLSLYFISIWLTRSILFVSSVFLIYLIFVCFVCCFFAFAPELN